MEFVSAIRETVLDLVATPWFCPAALALFLTILLPWYVVFRRGGGRR